MAFTTEFVMGAGGAQVEEIPVSMSGSGVGTVYPLTTVDAGDGAWVWVDGALSAGAGSSTSSPILNVGDRPYSVNGARAGGGGYFTGAVTVAIQSRNFSTTTFTGTVYVTRM